MNNQWFQILDKSGQKLFVNPTKESISSVALLLVPSLESLSGLKFWPCLFCLFTGSSNVVSDQTGLFKGILLVFNEL